MSSETSTQQYRRLVASGWLPPEEKVKLTSRIRELEDELKRAEDAIKSYERAIEILS